MPFLPNLNPNRTEFYVDRVSGSNLYAGSTKEMPILISQSGTWYNSLNYFQCSGSPNLTIVQTGMWVSIFPQGTGSFGATTLIAMVTGVNDITKIVFVSVMQRNAPGSLQFGSGNRTMIVGGPWYGPRNVPYAGAPVQQSSFPFGTANSGLWRNPNEYPRVNFLNNAIYEITGTITNTSVGPILWSSYENTPGDSGMIHVRGSGSGQGFVMYSATSAATDNTIEGFVFNRNGANGSPAGISIAGADSRVQGCVVNGVRGIGFLATASMHIIGCEAYQCNQSNTVGSAGFQLTGNGIQLNRCIAHHNSGLGTDGFNTGSAAATPFIFRQCISDSNSRHGFFLNGRDSTFMFNCDSYNNGQHGAYLVQGVVTVATRFYIENSNFIKNGGFGVKCDSPRSIILVYNCGFGSGNMANTSGIINTISVGAGVLDFQNNFVYPDNKSPWVDPNAGNFSISAPEAKQLGRSIFTQTPMITHPHSGVWFGGTVAKPNVGAAQNLQPTPIFNQINRSIN